MSKLRDLVRQAGRARPQAIGFGRAAESASPAVVVVAAVDGVEAARAAVEAKAAALLYVGAPGDVAGVIEAAESRPVGARVDAASGADAAALSEAGADFLVFDDGRAEAAALRPPALGRVPLLQGGEDEERLRMLAALEPDAALVSPPADATESGRVSARALASLRRRAELLHAPLAIALPDAVVDADTLEAWRDAGAPILLVVAEHVNSAVAAAAEVPPPRERPLERPTPLLPVVGTRSAKSHDHDDDEDEARARG